MMSILSVITVEILSVKRRSFKVDHDITPQVEGAKEVHRFLESIGREDLSDLIK